MLFVDFSGGDAGITLWRELSDIPYYTMIDKDTKYYKKVSSIVLVLIQLEVSIFILLSELFFGCYFQICNSAILTTFFVHSLQGDRERKIERTCSGALAEKRHDTGTYF